MDSGQLPQPASLVLRNSSRTFDGNENEILNKSHSKINGDLPEKILEFSVPCEQNDVPDLTRAYLLKACQFECYEEGLVRNTTQRGLVTFLKDINKIKEPTGCIVNEQLDTAGEAYIDGIHYVRMAELGRGSYGSVDLCQDTVTLKQFVRKTMKKVKFRSSEVIVPLNLRHPNLTKVFGLLQKDAEYVELMIEYAGQSLTDYLVNNKLNEKQIWNLSEQGLDGLAHMEHYDMVHLDIKPENICIQQTGTNDLRLKFTDFGSAKLVQESVTFEGWTPEYMAPESCYLFLLHKLGRLDEAGIGLTGKVDVFAFQLSIQYMYRRIHVLLNFITSGQSSYKGISEQKQKELRQNIIMLLATYPHLMPQVMFDRCDLDMKELLTKMAAFSPDDRLSAKEALAVVKARNERVANAEKLQCQYNETTLRRQSFTVRDNWGQVAIDNTNVPPIAQIKMNEGQRPLSKVKEQLRNKIKSPYPSGTKGKPMKERDGNTRGKAKAMTSKAMCPPTPIEELNRLSLACLQTNMETSSYAGINGYQESVPALASPVATPGDTFHDLDRYPLFDLGDILEVCKEDADVDTAMTGNVPNMDML